MKIVVAPDKFKGSLPATQVAAAIAAGLHAGRPGAQLVTIPVADGGEGTVDATVAAGFERVPVTAAGPTGDPVRASYARRGEVAVVELACVCGLARMPGGPCSSRAAPLTASSFGAGEVLRAALEAGAHRIILGVGGSASTDGGAGLLEALGARVLDARGEPAGRGGRALHDVAALDLTGLHPAASTAELTLAADVDNPLTGPDGAAEVYGPQKGASPAEVALLDAGLRHWAAVVAAAARHGVPVVAVAGRSALTEAELAAAGITAVYPLSDLEPDQERSRAEAARLLRQTGEMIARDRLAEAVTKTGAGA